MNQIAKSEEYRETELGELPVEWEMTTIGEIFNLKQGKQLSSKESTTGKRKMPFLRTSNLLWNKITVEKLDFMYFAEEEIEKYTLQKGDILVCEGGDVGRTALYNEEVDVCCYQNHLHRLRPKRDNYDKKFFVYWMIYAVLIRGMYIHRANRTTIPNLSGSRLKSFSIPLPPLPEQQKIAYVLSAIQDDKEKTENIINSYKELKKSLMKHLFKYGPVKFEDAERVELKETEIGEIPESWDIVKLDELAINAFGGGTPSTKIDKYWNGNIPWTTSAIIGEDDIYLKKFQKKITELGLSNSSSNIAKEGSLIIGTRVGVGKAVVTEFDVAISQDLTVIEINKGRGKPEFIAFLFKSYRIRNWFENNKRGATIKGVPRKDLLNLLLPVPSLPIQQEISEILSSIDFKIEQEQNKKKALEELFKSMIHNLMTAKIRVKDIEVKNEQTNNN